eukprot:XP_003729445.1 PREDICTED: decapping and exoribonuclease protein [Strongylocentrotus purpuratus]
MASSTALSNHCEVLGNFSIGENKKYRNDLSQRRFLIEPDDEPNFDLSQGLRQYTDRKPSGIVPTSMSPLLDWFHDHRDELIKKKILKSEGSSRKLDIDFVGRRGFFCRLLRAVASLDKLEILVTLCNGTYYIENVKDTDKERARQIEMGFGGKKFAQCITSPDGSSMPDLDEPVNAYAQYVAVMKTQYGDHRIILSTEVQAERKDSNQASPENYVCIKTRNDDLEGKPLANFKRYKTLQWWSQAYMAGIPEVICGMRDDRRHIITSVKTMKTNQLSFESEGFWDPMLCQKKFESYLSEIKKLVRDDDPRAVYRLQLPEIERGGGLKDKQRSRRFRLLGRKEDDYVILPDQYLKDVLDLKDY